MRLLLSLPEGEANVLHSSFNDQCSICRCRVQNCCQPCWTPEPWRLCSTSSRAYRLWLQRFLLWYLREFKYEIHTMTRYNFISWWFTKWLSYCVKNNYFYAWHIQGIVKKSFTTTCLSFRASVDAAPELASDSVLNSQSESGPRVAAVTEQQQQQFVQQMLQALANTDNGVSVLTTKMQKCYELEFFVQCLF